MLVSDKGYSLDLCFSNFDNVNFVKPLELLSKVDSHHIPSSFIISGIAKETLKVKEKLKNFRKANYERINADLAAIDWYSSFAGLDFES